MTKRKSLTDIRLITGFFREAHFQSLPIFFLVDGEEHSAQILEIREHSARSKFERRILSIRCNASLDLNGRKVEFKCAFSQFVAHWEGGIYSNQGHLETYLPTELIIQNHRALNRRPAVGEKILVPLLVQTGNSHAVEYLEIEDYSKFGIGGSITGTSGIPFTPETMVSGEWHSKTGSIKINGKVTQVRLIEQSNSHGPVRYKVGISLLSKSRSVSAPEKSNISNRKFTRFKTEHRLSFTSPINPDYQISLDLIDVSNAGFSAKLKDSGDVSLLILGGTLRLKNSTILAELISSENGTLRFQIVSGSSEDRIKWLKEIVTNTHKNVHTSVADGLDIIDLFCEAGAVSSQYIKNQNRLVDSFQRELSSDGTEDSWIHRWIQKDKSGKINGHICSVRISDQCWHLGELAGSADADRKISTEFIPQFFSGFKEYCLSLSPCPQIMIGWNEGHPFWKNWETYLKKKEGTVPFFKVYSNYYRYTSKLSNELLEDADYQFIEARNWGKLFEVTQLIKNVASREMISIFDFSKERFSSPYLKKIASESGFSFRREYLIFNFKKHSYLVVYSSFPLKSSLNQTLNVPWIFPIAEAPPLSTHGMAVIEKIKLIGAQQGFSFPGVLEVDCNSSNGESTINKRMIWYFGHPDILAFFKEVE